MVGGISVDIIVYLQYRYDYNNIAQSSSVVESVEFDLIDCELKVL